MYNLPEPLFVLDIIALRSLERCHVKFACTFSCSSSNSSLRAAPLSSLQIMGLQSFSFSCRGPEIHVGFSLMNQAVRMFSGVLWYVLSVADNDADNIALEMLSYQSSMFLVLLYFA